MVAGGAHRSAAKKVWYVRALVFFGLGKIHSAIVPKSLVVRTTGACGKAKSSWYKAPFGASILSTERSIFHLRAELRIFTVRVKF